MGLISAILNSTHAHKGFQLNYLCVRWHTWLQFSLKKQLLAPSSSCDMFWFIWYSCAASSSSSDTKTHLTAQRSSRERDSDWETDRCLKGETGTDVLKSLSRPGLCVCLLSLSVFTLNPLLHLWSSYYIISVSTRSCVNSLKSLTADCLQRSSEICWPHDTRGRGEWLVGGVRKVNVCVCIER